MININYYFNLNTMLLNFTLIFLTIRQWIHYYNYFSIILANLIFI